MPVFTATVEAANRSGHFVQVPADIAATIGAKHMLQVKGTPYRSNLAKIGGRLILGVHKSTLEAAGIDRGDSVAITIEADAEPR